MNKICPKCKRKQEDPHIMACSICEELYVDPAQLVSTFTKDELKFIAACLAKSPRIYVILVVALAISTISLYKLVSSKVQSQIQTFQSTTSNQVVTAYSQATNHLQVQFKSFAQNASNQIASAQDSISNQITKEFRTSNITTTVQMVASNQAKGMVESQVKFVMDGFRSNVTTIVQTISSNQAKGMFEAQVQPIVDKFTADTEFLRMATRARAYDFKAYLWLLDLAKQTNVNSVYADEIIDELDRSLQSLRNDPHFRLYAQFGGTDQYNGPFTTDEIGIRFPSALADKYSQNREGYFHTARTLNQPLFLALFISALSNETELVAADNLTTAISELSKQNFHPRDIQAINEWWSNHQHEYTNYPIGEINNGLNFFNSRVYSQAANLLEQVLKVDPSADFSRSILIASYYELGETNRAIDLAKTFHDPSGRWAIYAEIKSELENGYVTNATVKLAKFAHDYPYILDGISTPYYWDIWRKIDRDLFEKTSESLKASPSKK